MANDYRIGQLDEIALGTRRQTIGTAEPRLSITVMSDFRQT
jgi:hypothetical protein